MTTGCFLSGYKGEKMRRIFIFSNLFFISFYCFAQLPGKIIGKIPDKNSPMTFQIQVGAYRLDKNAEDAFLLLKKNALTPAREKYLDFTRVMIKGIPAGQVANFLAVIREAGFNEVIIREDPPAAVNKNSISEKWEINSPGSAYSSFEFNHDMHYIAVGNDDEKSTHFGEYSMPQKDTINMDNLGTAVVKSSDDAGIDFSFYHIDDPEKEMSYSASKAEPIAESPRLDLICRTWKVANCTDSDFIGYLLIISNTGTYFFTTPDGNSHSMSSWRWYGDKMEEFDYSHDNWEHYGRAKILNLKADSLELHDPGYLNSVQGYSTGNNDDYWTLVPANSQGTAAK